MTNFDNFPTTHEPRYTINHSTITQGNDNSMTVDLVIKPPVVLGDKLGDFLYGAPEQLEVNTLSIQADSTHAELKTLPREGRPVKEVTIALGRLEQYLEADRDPKVFRTVRHLLPIDEQAMYE